ncbi:uncharacterized protein LOC130722639 [Lotus japonicus]|uniref:uncharacterized protein LOC130722639 n=1 Tax=Lotus japonicus TaxID=34305 RepID=UPI00258AC0A2|nr:uncharacterized protein LOC130722639 [Lotus japonicus]
MALMNHDIMLFLKVMNAAYNMRWLLYLLKAYFKCAYECFDRRRRQEEITNCVENCSIPLANVQQSFDHEMAFFQLAISWNSGKLAITPQQTCQSHNLALLGKNVWQVIKGEDKPWVSLVKEKYGVHGNFLSAPVRRGSVVWRAILKTKEVMQGGFSFKLGNGSSSFWFDEWLGNFKLGAIVPAVDIHDVQLTVCDMVRGGSWDLAQLYTSLPSDIIDSILARGCLLNERVPDCWTWSFDSSGLYSAKSGYQWLIHERLPPAVVGAYADWNWIWRLKGPFKILFLVWLGCQKALPVNLLRFQRNMAASPMCSRCNLYPETILHCLRDCWFARRVWLRLGLAASHPSFALPEPNQWFKRVVEEAEAVSLAAIWAIWTARNRAYFDHTFIPEEKVLRSILDQKELFLLAWPPLQRTSEPRLVS